MNQYHIFSLFLAEFELYLVKPDQGRIALDLTKCFSDYDVKDHVS